jgi:hypothetical protein
MKALCGTVCGTEVVSDIDISLLTKSNSSGDLHMGLYSKIWMFGAKIHLQQDL